MATMTGENLLNSIIESTGVEINALIFNTLSARLQQMIDNGTYSNLAAGISMSGFSTVINGATEIGDLSDAIETNKALIEAAAEGTVGDIEFPPYGGEAPITFTLTASADQINEGEANTFTVTASRAVEEDTVVTFQLKIDADGDTAQLADFNAGAFNADPVTIAAGETTATFDVTAITNDGTEVSEKYTVEATVDGETYSEQVTILDGSVGAGQTFVLTENLDVIPGMDGSNGNTVTSGDDLIIGSFDAAAGTTTMNVTDQIDAGEGNDTLRIIAGDDLTDAEMPNITDVETFQIQGAGTATITLDTTTQAGLENLNVTAAGGAVDLTAADTTDINVAGAKDTIDLDGGLNVMVTDNTADKAITIGATTVSAGSIMVTDSKQGTGNIAIDGGTDVEVDATVTLADAGAPIVAGTIDVGTGGADADIPTGAVAITQNLVSDATDDLTGDAITTVGGTSVDIVANGTQNAKDKDATGATLTFGAVDVTGDGNTESVSVTQAYSETEFPAVAAITEAATANVTFKAMAEDDTVTVNGLTFTATKALTAAEVAQAFSELILADTQDGGGPTANGYYSGTFDSYDWTTGVANGAVVPFTANTNAVASPALASSAAGALPTASDYDAGSFTAAVPVTANAAAYGTVAIDDDATPGIESITLDGYGVATLGAGGSLDALTSLSLANSTAAATLTTTATALDLEVNKVTGAAAVNLGATVTDLDVTATGTASSITLTAANTQNLIIDAAVNLTVAGNVGNTANTLQTVDINGAGAVVLSAAPFGSTGLKSFDASDNTGGVTATINADTASVDASFTDYVFSEGADVVTVNNAAVNKNINLGAGNDSLELASTPTVAGTIDGGTGTNTLVMDAPDAAAASTSTAFASKVINFSALTLQNNTAGVAGQQTTLSFTNDNMSAGDGVAFSITGLSGGALDITAAGDGLFDTNFATTLGNIATTIDADADVFSATVSGTDIVIVGNDGVTFTVGAETTVDQNTVVTNIVTENIGTEVWEIDFTENAAMDGGDSIQLNADGTAINEAFAVDFATTLGNIATAIAVDADIASAIVAGNKITITAAVAGNNLTIDGYGFTDAGGASDVAAVINNTVVAGSYAEIALTDGAGNEAMAPGDEIEVAIGADTFTQAFDTDYATTYAALITQINGHADYAAVDNGGTIEITSADESVALGAVTSTYTDYDTDIDMTQTTTNTVAGGDEVDLEALGGYDYVRVGDATGLQLNNMASDGTVVVDDANVFTTVAVKDADEEGSDDDVLNIIVEAEDAGETAGIVAANDVETFNLNAKDLNADGNADGATAFAANGDAVTTINVEGAADLTLTTDSTVLEVVNAAAMTGMLTYTAGVAQLEVTGGSAGDELIADASQVVINGGAGADQITVSNNATSAIINGGDGNDVFDFTGALLGLETYATIEDFNAGDQVKLNADSFVSTGIVATEPEVLTDWFNAAFNQLDADTASWFQHNGNTYIVENGATAGFQLAEDVVVKLSGLKDLSDASFNDAGTLEMA